MPIAYHKSIMGQIGNREGNVKYVGNREGTCKYNDLGLTRPM